ncbi:LysR family transcriptional regulator [Paraburkholderia ginsengiterrae]|uniref:LysR family transcriptional regulator n=1 Tax=Paraburkholderia ginsengiterrae TaxID=1462993 RepID=A0A1A9N9S8_9BURK|nr:LysR family transcriptional regulator [Paraburkholderia ginsengiterrae]OAJ62502.1 LysR family transcriptional regulator [Paraburkholderia ginsengiterrae]OAJ62629.1 LysR family transcriptional regulator [Paraburkholderia ginsengiterrae]
MEDIAGGIVSGLTALAALAESKSFGRAATRLGKTQPAISRAIQRLEDRLRAKLVHRTSRHVEVTDAGHELLSKVLPLLQGIEEATVGVSDQTSIVKGTLRVACDAAFARLVLAPELAQFLKDHPALQLKLETRNDLTDLVSDGFDLAIRFGPPSVSTLVCRRLYSPRILTVAAPSYLDHRGRPRSPKDLVDDGHECILAIDPATSRPFEWEFWRGNEKVKVAVSGNLTVTDAGTKLGACLAGYGIAQVIDLGIDAHLRAGTLEPVLTEWPDETFPLYVYYPSRNHVPAKVRAFIDFVVGMMP